MTEKKRYRPNFFDIVVLLILAALVVGFIAVLRSRSTGSAVSGSTSSVTYTVEIMGALEGTSQYVHIGDSVVENTKNYAMGSVLAVETLPYTLGVEDISAGVVRQVAQSGYENIRLTIESEATITDKDITTSGGFVVKVGAACAVEGPGYAGNGYVIGIER